MRPRTELLFFALVACSSSAEDAPPNADRRVEIADSPAARGAGRSVAIVVKRSQLPAPKDGRISLKPEPLGERLGLCADERFADQPSSTVGGATAFLVAGDKVATAAHVIDDVGGDADFAVAFGYEGSDASVAEGDVYAAKDATKGAGDFAIVTLERSVADRPPLVLRREGEAEIGQAVVVVGHPLGLSMKAAPGTVRVKENGAIFFDTDTNQGNSGSPVLTGDVVEGLFFAGGEDFTTTAEGCKKRIARAPNDLTERAVPATVLTSLLGP
jgi:S1-C subfamily serine protease